MSEATPMAAMLQNVLPDALLRSIEQNLVDDEVSAIDRYKILLRGFEKYDLQKHIQNNLLKFDEALRDLIACLHCTGTCRTKCGNGYYYALHRHDIESYGNRPKFRVFECPGVAARKEQLRCQYVAADRDDEPPAKRFATGQ